MKQSRWDKDRYQKRLKMKKRTRRQVMRQMWSRHFESEEDYLAHPPVYRLYPISDRDRYKKIYLSGCRKYAKEQTNSMIRAQYRDLSPIDILDLDDDAIIVMRAGDYKKVFDYDWTIW